MQSPYHLIPSPVPNLKEISAAIEESSDVDAPREGSDNSLSQSVGAWKHTALSEIVDVHLPSIAKLATTKLESVPRAGHRTVEI